MLVNCKPFAASIANNAVYIDVNSTLIYYLKFSKAVGKKLICLVHLKTNWKHFKKYYYLQIHMFDVESYDDLEIMIKRYSYLVSFF